MTEPAKSSRVALLDTWRGVTVLVMVGWHLAWDLGMFGVFPQYLMMRQPALGIRYYIICSFVLLSGISCRYSRSNARRGMQTLACALVVSLVTALAGDPVVFGVLHLLGCCMLFYALIGERFEKLPPLPAAAVCFALFLILHKICYGIRVNITWLWMFGFRTREFYSSDYYPIFPWLFLFLVGAVVGGWIRSSDGAWKHRAGVAPLNWVGRHALWIYMVHQPVLLGCVWLFTRLRG